jgi:uncharacterized PurR-regulated membrane protein YhhQ (DUF165 family)
MQNPAVAWTLIGVGVLLVLISTFANFLGLGAYPGFGWKKTLGVVIGAAIILIGLYFRRRSGASR